MAAREQTTNLLFAIASHVMRSFSYEYGKQKKNYYSHLLTADGGVWRGIRPPMGVKGRNLRGSDGNNTVVNS